MYMLLKETVNATTTTTTTTTTTKIEFWREKKKEEEIWLILHVKSSLLQQCQIYSGSRRTERGNFDERQMNFLEGFSTRYYIFSYWTLPRWHIHSFSRSFSLIHYYLLSRFCLKKLKRNPLGGWAIDKNLVTQWP